ncbi:unnamed protein product [Lactuca virosa]|uniref:Uncharacterized protein n=1 Tax=Lactuca virosa TaxID=75947 RepID=A0AAU9MPQ4_9ASTR|nr:unnamed protein product [Lactuca virosa]
MRIDASGGTVVREDPLSLSLTLNHHRRWKPAAGKVQQPSTTHLHLFLLSSNNPNTLFYTDTFSFAPKAAKDEEQATKGSSETPTATSTPSLPFVEQAPPTPHWSRLSLQPFLPLFVVGNEDSTPPPSCRSEQPKHHLRIAAPSAISVHDFRRIRKTAKGSRRSSLPHHYRRLTSPPPLFLRESLPEIDVRPSSRFHQPL